MKKYKIHWSVFNLFQDTQKEVSKLQTYVKTLTASTFIGTTWYEANTNHSLYIAMAGFAIDLILSGIYLEEKK
jgi:hypothetical protein